MSESYWPPITPPSSPGPNQAPDDLETYFVTNLPSFTAETLILSAEAAGHPRDAIDAALARANERLREPRELTARARLIAMGLFSIGFAVLAVQTLGVGGSYLFPQTLAFQFVIGQAVLVLIGLGISLWTISAVARRVGSRSGAIAWMLLVPVLVFVAFPGSCIFLIASAYR